MRKMTLIIIVLGVLFLAAAILAVYFYRQYEMILRDPGIVTRQEAKNLTQSISSFMELPKNEEPSVATITDKTKLTNQRFFAKSENGDKLILYTKAGLAILYRPSTGKVVVSSPINYQDEAKKQPLRIAVFNGAKKPGLAEETKNKIIKEIPDVIISTDNTQDENPYGQTLVVILSEVDQKVVDKVVKIVGGQISSLPKGEKKPDSDILVIIGNK